MTLWLGWLLACGGADTPSSPPATPETPAAAPNAAAPAPEGWTAPRPTQLKRYTVGLTLEPDPPPMGELFAVSATVTDRDGQPIENAKVVLDARMPQHAHGMQTRPVPDKGTCDEAGTCTHPGGVYRATGFKFHMPGEWTVTVDINGPEGPDSTSFVYPLGSAGG